MSIKKRYIDGHVEINRLYTGDKVFCKLFAERGLDDVKVTLKIFRPSGAVVSDFIDIPIADFKEWCEWAMKLAEATE